MGLEIRKWAALLRAAHSPNSIKTEGMKHRSWIKNYEDNFAKLAEEIGDLRYDTLAEFLELLGRKIEKDGQKDRSRGRIKLAANLQSAANALIKSSEVIKEAWQICEPYMFPKDITEKIRNGFHQKHTRAEVFKLISDFYRDFDEDVYFRLARCLLFQTNGDIKKSKKHIKLAYIDPRDMIAHAEYDNKMN